MNKWAVRIVGLVMLLFFALVFVGMHSALKRMAEQQQQSAAPR